MKNYNSKIRASCVIVLLTVCSLVTKAQDIPLDSLNGSPSPELRVTTPIPDTDIIATPTTNPSPLAEELAKQLGITPDQGAAGAGSILRYAKQKMSVDEFQKISESIPGMDHILTAGPTANDSDLAESVAAIESENPGVAAMLLKNDFDQIGLAPDMVEKFVPIIIDYVKMQGGKSSASLLQKALPGI